MAVNEEEEAPSASSAAAEEVALRSSMVHQDSAVSEKLLDAPEVA